MYSSLQLPHCYANSRAMWDHMYVRNQYHTHRSHVFCERYASEGIIYGLVSVTSLRSIETAERIGLVSWSRHGSFLPPIIHCV